MALKYFVLPDVTVSTAGTRVQLSATATPVSTVIITAKAANSGKIYVGDDTVAAGTGTELAAGSSLAVSADMSGRPGGEEFVLSDFYIDAATNGDKVAVAYIKRR